MNTPNIMTESVEKGAIFEIQENFRKINTQISQSSEAFFGNFTAESELNFERKFDEFLGDSEDSTEISVIISSLNFSSSPSSSNSSNSHSREHNQKPQSDADSENIEILNILKRSPQTTKNLSAKGISRNAISPVCANNAKSGLLPAKPIAVKKISLAGRVLKGFDSDANSEANSPIVVRNFGVNLDRKQAANRPVRSSNPIFQNCDSDDAFNANNNFNEVDKRFHFFEQFQLNKF